MADITKPDDLLLPDPENQKELDLYKSLQDYTKSLNNTFTDLEDIEAITAGTGLTDTSNTFSVNVDDSTIEIVSNSLQVKDLGIVGAKIGADAIDGSKVADSSIDSEHIVSGAIDLAHMSVDSVDSDQYVDGSIDTVHIGDNQITAAKLVDDIVFDQFPSTPSAAPDSDYEVANKKYVDDNSGGVYSYTLFNWNGIENYVSGYCGFYAGTTNDPNISTATIGYGYFGVYDITERIFLRFEYKHSSDISTVSIYARIWSDASGADDGATIKVDIGGVNNTVTRTSSTPGWATVSSIDMSTLVDGQVYEGVISLKSNNASVAHSSYCSAITLIAN